MPEGRSEAEANELAGEGNILLKAVRENRRGKMPNMAMKKYR
jgi:hypothetical protein